MKKKMQKKLKFTTGAHGDVSCIAYHLQSCSLHLLNFNSEFLLLSSIFPWTCVVWRIVYMGQPPILLSHTALEAWGYGRRDSEEVLYYI